MVFSHLATLLRCRALYFYLLFTPWVTINHLPFASAAPGRYSVGFPRPVIARSFTLGRLS